MSAIPGPSLLLALPAALRLLADPRVLITDYARRYGEVFRLFMPDHGRFVPLVFLLGPAGNERILAAPHKADFSWYGGYGFTMEPMFGRDILFLLDDTAERPAHRDRHRALAPAFHARLDPLYIATVRALTEARIATWPEGGEIDLAAEIRAIAFHVVAQLLLGAVGGELPALAARFEEIGVGLYSVLRLDLPGFRFARGLAARRVVAEELRRRIAGFRASGLPDNMLGALMRSRDECGEPLADESLVAELVAFLFAGHDTTSSLLSSLFIALEQRGDVYDGLRAEAASLVDWSATGLAGQRLLDAAITETERLHPPLVFSLRGVLRDFEFGGYTIRAGSKVAYSSWYTGRMDSLFERPGEFRPERFSGGATAPAWSLLAFGGGHRPCIGRRFAGIELRVVASAILRRWRFEFIAGQSEAVFFNPTLQRRHGYRVRVTSAGWA